MESTIVKIGAVGAKAVGMMVARENLKDLANRVCYGNERIVLQNNGANLAVLISLPELRRLSLLAATAESQTRPRRPPLPTSPDHTTEAPR